jgi:hypothetical protein
MRQIYKYVLLLFVFNFILLGISLLTKSINPVNLFTKDILILSLLFSVISVITLIIFFRGRTREPDSGTMHTLVAVSLKFLLDMILALVWFYISKKTSLASVFIFFVLYLTLTLFILFVILKALRYRSL